MLIAGSPLTMGVELSIDVLSSASIPLTTAVARSSSLSTNCSETIIGDGVTTSACFRVEAGIAGDTESPTLCMTEVDLMYVL